MIQTSDSTIWFAATSKHGTSNCHQAHFVAQMQGFFSYKNGQFCKHDMSYFDTNSQIIRQPTGMVKDNNDNIIFGVEYFRGTFKADLIQFNGSQFSNYISGESPIDKSHPIKVLKFDSLNNELWISNNGKVYTYNGSNWALIYNAAVNLLFSISNNITFLIGDDKIYKLNNKTCIDTITFIDLGIDSIFLNKQELLKYSLDNLIINQQGNMLLGINTFYDNGAGHGLFEYDGTNLKDLSSSSLTTNFGNYMTNKISSIIPLDSITILVGSDGYGLYKINTQHPDSTINYNFKNGQLPDFSVSNMLKTLNGDIWIATRYGLSVYNEQGVSQIVSNKYFNNLTNKSKIKIKVNQQNKTITLLDIKHSKVSNIKLFDIRGRKVYSNDHIGNAYNSFNIDISTFSNGFYILKLNVDNRDLTKRINLIN